MGSRVKKYRMKPIPAAFSEKGGNMPNACRE